MPLSAAATLLLASQCAPMIAPETLVSVARVESAFDPLAVGVNGAGAMRIHPRSLAEAVGVAARLIGEGVSVDLGLGQINSSNLNRLGLTVVDAFEPCRNLHAAGKLLQQAYQAQSPFPGREQVALRAALSIYNTGSADRGFKNGYVAKVTAAARITASPRPSLERAVSAAPAPSWDVFARARGSSRIAFTAAPTGDIP